MILDKENFVINIIQVSKQKEILSTNISNINKGFSNCNESDIINNSLKYKIIFENLEILENTELIIFQVSLKLDNDFYNPYLFLPINNSNISNRSVGKGRGIIYNLVDNKFNYIWMFFTRDYIEKILNNFDKEKQITSPNIYIQEYI